MEEGLMSEEGEIEFLDAHQQYSSKQQGITYKEIIFSHMTKISNLCIKEFREGYWEERPLKVGDSVFVIKTYKEDSRDAYINAVDFLYRLLLPNLEKRSDIKNKIKEIYNEADKKNKTTNDVNEWKDYKLLYRNQIFEQLCLLINGGKIFQAESIR